MRGRWNGCIARCEIVSLGPVVEAAGAGDEGK